MKIDRMDLADLGSPKALATGILKLVPNMPVPVPIEDIARAVDITDIRTIGAAGFEGGLITDRDKSEGVILVNRRSERRRQRFTVGHELGHFLLPLHLPSEGTKFMCTSEDMIKSDMPKLPDRAARMEVEANRFAAEILMPLAPFRVDLQHSGVFDLELLLRISDKFDISKQATARRFCELIDIPNAVVFSKDGRVLYSIKSRNFPFIPLRRGDDIPKGSLTARFNGSQGEISNMAVVDGYWWIDAKPYCKWKIHEQILIQASDYRLTLLQIDEDEMEEKEEEEKLIDAYTPRFSRR